MSKPETPDVELDSSIEPAKTLYGAINAVMQEVGYVYKDKRNSQQGFSFAGEAAILRKMRPALVKHGLMILPVEVKSWERMTYTTGKGTQMFRSDVTMRYQLVHTSGESISVEAVGTGMDSGDKDASKALTIALKYVWRQSFGIETGDDPDADTPEPVTPPSKPTVRTPAPKVEPKPAAPVTTKPAAEAQPSKPETPPEPLPDAPFEIEVVSGAIGQPDKDGNLTIKWRDKTRTPLFYCHQSKLIDWLDMPDPEMFRGRIMVSANERHAGQTHYYVITAVYPALEPMSHGN
ncbi:MAG TPA: ERF family protein [Dissulfurispiraceae bacterium]|nr:ERF family protein [Dissulfurispiraceae bacterium]